MAAALARKAGHPVKVTMSRTEVFEASGPSSGTNIRIKLRGHEGRPPDRCGSPSDLRGGYPGSPVSPACQCMMAPYDIPNAWIEALTWW